MTKAFDTVSHQSVLDALSDLGVEDTIYNWVASYLLDRWHYTKYNNCISCERSFNAGVIQGSGLGPVLFVCVIASLVMNCSRNSLIKYADDCYMIVPATSYETLPSELQNVKCWSAQRNLQINCNKSKVMIITTKKKGTLLHCVNNPNVGLDVVDKMVILGVHLQNNINFGNHVSDIVKHCNKLFYCLRIMKEYHAPSTTIRDVFFATIIPRITYAALAWIGFCSEADKQRLYKIIQRGCKLGYIQKIEVNLEDIIFQRESRLFKYILDNSYHVFHTLMLPEKLSNYSLRARSHN